MRSVSARKENSWSRAGKSAPALNIFAAVRPCFTRLAHRIMTTVFATALAEGLATLNQFEAALHTIDAAIASSGDGFGLHSRQLSLRTLRKRSFISMAKVCSAEQTMTSWRTKLRTILGRIRRSAALLYRRFGRSLMLLPNGTVVKKPSLVDVEIFDASFELSN